MRRKEIEEGFTFQGEKKDNSYRENISKIHRLLFGGESRLQFEENEELAIIQEINGGASCVEHAA